MATASGKLFSDRILELYLDSLPKYEATVYRRVSRQERVYPHVWSGWQHWRARWSNNFEDDIHREGYYDGDVWCDEPFHIRGAFKGWGQLLRPMRTVYDEVPAREVKETRLVTGKPGASTFEPMTWEHLVPGVYHKVMLASDGREIVTADLTPVFVGADDVLTVTLSVTFPTRLH